LHRCTGNSRRAPQVPAADVPASGSNGLLDTDSTVYVDFAVTVRVTAVPAGFPDVLGFGAMQMRLNAVAAFLDARSESAVLCLHVWVGGAAGGVDSSASGAGGGAHGNGSSDTATAAPPVAVEVCSVNIGSLVAVKASSDGAEFAPFTTADLKDNGVDEGAIATPAEPTLRFRLRIDDVLALPMLNANNVQAGVGGEDAVDIVRVSIIIRDKFLHDVIIVETY
jgi:hypothetical protein